MSDQNPIGQVLHGRTNSSDRLFGDAIIHTLRNVFCDRFVVYRCTEVLLLLTVIPIVSHCCWFEMEMERWSLTHAEQELGLSISHKSPSGTAISVKSRRFAVCNICVRFTPHVYDIIPRKHLTRRSKYICRSCNQRRFFRRRVHDNAQHTHLFPVAYFDT